jgi:hypothetical protein
MFCITIGFTVMATTIIPFLEFKPVFYREFDAKMYDPAPYYLAYSLV